MDFREIIDLWPSVAELARDVDQSRWRVQKWRDRNSIPARHWTTVMRAAKARKLPVTFDRLAEAAEIASQAA